MPTLPNFVCVGVIKGTNWLDMVNVPSTKPVVLPSHTFNKLRFEVLNKLLIATAYMLLEL
jgi:hypothetical protein|tara:strand:- start:1748 stop:1927 length:180 start_codon:yes stop_codon:yes gene_type:complete